MDPKRRPQKECRGWGPRLDRWNAAKNIGYDAGQGGAESASSPSPAESPGLRCTRSLDVPRSSYSNQTSFRIAGGVDGDVELLLHSLGLSGPEDFAVSEEAWVAHKSRSNSDVLPKTRLFDLNSPGAQDRTSTPSSVPASTIEEPAQQNAKEKIDGQQDMVDGVSRQQDVEVEGSNSVDKPVDEAKVNDPCLYRRKGDGDRGIRGIRPPVLSPPTPISSPAHLPPVLSSPPSIPLLPEYIASSPWDLIMSFAPAKDSLGFCTERETMKSFDFEEEEEDGGNVAKWAEGRIGETSEGFTGTSSLSTTNDDDASSMTTETMFIVSPNGRLKRTIKSWLRGALLGSGSFGVVYEAISDGGVFFAVKEVSLLDQGSNAQQCIVQLEQEIALLSQFEHENIVQYYGTDKEESKLYIFLELATQGSLASLYQKYHLRASQVSAYTRQILNGLVYLHDRNVVHRDIKCANILVHANGSVKLADFGLAKEMNKINMLKSCKGSAYWMAPEVVNPKKTYGPAADIWSLGCTILEMLTRQIPYPNVEWQQAFFKIGQGEQPPIPANLSRDARDFIAQCVRVDPDERPSAQQLLQHLFVNRS